MTNLRMIGLVVMLVSVLIGCMLPLLGVVWISLGPTVSIAPDLVQTEASVDRRVALPLAAVLLLGIVCLSIPKHA